MKTTFSCLVVVYNKIFGEKRKSTVLRIQIRDSFFRISDLYLISKFNLDNDI
jgi:hypothetical protein